MMPSLTKFEVLRVLDFQGCNNVHCYNLKYLGKLLQLRYLGLRCTAISELPGEIGDLNFLQTLDIRQTALEELPRGIGQLRQLKRISMEHGCVRVPEWMGNLASLEDLSVDNVSESPNFVKELSKLTELRRLNIYIGELGVEGWKCKALAESLEKLQKIQVLGIWSTKEANLETHVPSGQLRELFLATVSSRLPMWINSLLLPNLTYIWVSLKDVKEQDIEVLGRFPELLTMQLIIKISAGGGSDPPCECSGGLFPKLKHYATPAPLLALKGAMPSIESIKFQVHVRSLKDSKFNFDFGSLMNLPLLEKAEVNIICTGAHTHEVEEAEAALTHAVQVHPNHPFLSLTRYGIHISPPCSSSHSYFFRASCS
jgi:disease resistance protein RPM1